MTGNNTAQQQVFVKMVHDAWHSKLGQFDKLLSELSDEQLQKEVAPGRNRGIYLLGHLTALADSIFPLLGYEKIAEHLFQPFVHTPDKQTGELPAVSELRQEWTRVKTSLAEKMAAISPEEWFQRHTSVSQEDFEKEPHRNKLNVVLSRTSHFDYHLGQLQFLKTR
ncbi:DinB family protein [Chitinophaga lutea]|uniref:DinB family protein n=1 Tax=Chitinophaga lutea TaxID=2488634 RepID=A0A3N4PUR6_9BACT|nr:DinB family protein [Chitinophaga lutea]RPE07907.1 DinB family protein [Chitinophaga lutea]